MMEKKPLAMYFWAKVNKDGPIPERCPALGPCWLWTGSKSVRGYGNIAVEGKCTRATHVAIFLETGEWPKLQGCHKCDNPPCVRFSHLFEGTHKENGQDAGRKRRMASGERHGKAKLTWEQVREIRAEYAKGDISSYDLAKKYQVSPPNVGAILRFQTWKEGEIHER